MKEIEIIIDSEGKTEIDLKGFAGKGCGDITDELIKGIGGEVIQRDKHCDYYKPQPKTKVKQQQSF